MWSHIIAFFLGAVIIYFVWKCFIPSDNIFLKPIPPDPDRITMLNEDDIIKVGYDEKKVKEKYDVIVIGSGAAGLSAASILASEGKSVLVLEQSDQLGGLTCDFEEQGVFFPTGTHILNAVNYLTEGNLLWLKIFDKVSENKLKFYDLENPIYVGHINERERYHLMSGRKEYEKYLCEKFPGFSKEIVSYMDLCAKLVAEMQVVLMLRNMPDRIQKAAKWVLEKICRFKWFKLEKMRGVDYLRSHFKQNEKLVKVFTLLGSGIGNPLSGVLPGSIMGVVQGAFNGSSHFIGGPHEFAKKTTKVIMKYGGQALCNARVKRLVTKGKKCVGVEMERNGRRIMAKHVVSTVGVYNTYMMLEEKLRPPILKEYEPSCGHFFIFISLDCSFEEVGINSGATTFAANMLDEKFLEEVKELSNLSRQEKEDYVFENVVCCGHLDKNGKNVLVIMFQTNYEVFKKWENLRLKQRGNEYEELKEKFATEILKPFHRHYPKLEEHMDVFFTGTTLSTKHWLNYSFGESYGIRNDFNREKMYGELIRKSQVKNLIFSGVDTFICDGVTPALMSGVAASEKILGRWLLFELLYAVKAAWKMHKKVVK